VEQDATHHGVVRYLPVLDWLPGYDRSWLGRDALAGLTVWALVVPESMAYAAIAGVPLEYGLYTAPLALVGYVIFGGCRQLFVGPSATVASISAVSVAAAMPGSAPAGRFIALTALLALMVGGVYILLGLLRMGFVARFFAKPVLDGFIVGLGLYIAVGQLPTLVGIHKPAGDTLAVFVRTVARVGSWQWATVAVGVLALAALFALARFAPKLPGALVVVALAILATRALDLEGHGVAVVGNIPTGFHFVSWSGMTWGEVWALVPGAIAVVVVGFAQSVAIAKSYGARFGYRVDASQEMIGYGAANLGAGALQGFTVTGSLSKSAAAEEAGGRSPVLLLVTSGAVVLTIVVLAGLFENLPEAALAAVVIHAVSGMIDFGKLARLWRLHRDEFMLAAGALLGVVVAGILAGVVIGVALSFVLLIHRLDHPHVALLGRNPEGTAYVDVAAHPEAISVPGLLVHRFEAPLIFANAEIFADRVLEAVEAADPPPRAVVLDLVTVPDVDSTGDAALAELLDTLDGRGIEFAVARATASLRERMQTDGVVSVLGAERIFPTVRDAVAVLGRPPADPSGGRSIEPAPLPGP
jgi:SulP family sulfate permease